MTGVQVIRDGETITVEAPVVVSDIGPAATVKLLGEENVPADYQDLVKKGDRPTAMISVNFASQERLVDVPGMLSFAKSRRLAYIANFTDMCPRWPRRGGICTSARRCPSHPSANSTRPPKPSCCFRTCATPSTGSTIAPGS